jgi:hypothetical protein
MIALQDRRNRTPLLLISHQKRKISKSKAHDRQSGPSTGAARAKDLPSKRFLWRFLAKQIVILQALFRTIPA